MAVNVFDIEAADSQATEVPPVSPKTFDFDAYEDYEYALRDRCRSFCVSDSGVLVYRSVRVAEVFSLPAVGRCQAHGPDFGRASTPAS